MSARPLIERLGLEPGPEQGGQRLVLALVVSMTMSAALALSLVWLNLERTNLAYRVRELQNQVQKGLDLNSKLFIERDHLLSPKELDKKAGPMGLGAARPGQIRRIHEDGESSAQNDKLQDEKGDSR